MAEPSAFAMYRSSSYSNDAENLKNQSIKTLFNNLDITSPLSTTSSSGIGYYGKNGISTPTAYSSNALLSYDGPGSIKINNNSSDIPDPDPDTTSTTSGWDLFNTSMKGINGLVNAGLGINNAVQGWMNFRENKKLINKQMQAIDEQIAASKEYRQQRADEIARLNKVRKNTQKAFNTGTTITRSY